MYVSDNKGIAEADQGVVDLRNWNFDKNEIIYLDGEWEFYPHSHLMPGDNGKSTDDLNRSTITVPSDWINSFNENRSGENIGTYRLRVLVDDEQLNGSYKIQLPKRTAVSKMFINGELAIDNHFDKADFKDRNPNSIDRSASFQVSQTKLKY